MTTMTAEQRQTAIGYQRGYYDEVAAQLPAEPDRVKRGDMLDLLAETAGSLAGLMSGNAAEDDEHGDSLAWLDAASLLRALAAAERGTVAGAPDPDGSDPDLVSEWDLFNDLAVTVTRAERRAALAAVLAVLDAVRRDGRPRYRKFAVVRFRDAAAACTAAYPETWPSLPAARA